MTKIKDQNKSLNIKYALINAFYFLFFCGSGSYGYNFLKYSHFDTALIGAALALTSVCALVLQIFVAPVIDRSEKWSEKKMLVVIFSVNVLLYAGMLFLPAGSFLLLAVCVVGFALTMSGIPFLNSLAFAYEQEGNKINYGIGRGFGSAAYAAGSLAIGTIVSMLGGGNEIIVKVLPYYLIITGLATIGCLLTFKDPKKAALSAQESSQISYREFFHKYHKIFLVVGAMTMVFFCHMMINTYMIDILLDIGGNTGDQGRAVFIQAMSELPTMLVFAALLKKCRVNLLMIIGAVCFSLKHLAVCFAPNVGVFYAAMALQMLSYAVMIPASVYFSEEYVAQQDRNKGQTVMNASTTIAGLTASLFGGFLFSAFQVHTVLVIGLIISLLGTVLMVIGVKILEKSK